VPEDLWTEVSDIAQEAVIKCQEIEENNRMG